MAQDLNVRQAEALCKRLAKPAPEEKPQAKAPTLPKEVELSLHEIIGNEVKVKYKEGKGTLTVKDGKMTVHFTLSGKGFTQVFVGSAEDAQKEGAAVIDAVEDTLNFSDGTTDTANGFDVPVEELNEAFALAAMGKKSAKWYDHTLCVSNPVQQ